MFNNPYYNNAQNSIDRIDNQIKELETMRAQLQRNIQPSINQTFQISQNSGGIKFVSGIEDVNKELVLNDTLFVNKDFSMLWLKTVKGEIKTYELHEVIEKDEKDLIIEKLQKQIEDMKGKDAYEQFNDTDVSTKSKECKSSRVSNDK